MNSEPSVVEVTLESDLEELEVVEEIVRRVSATAGLNEEAEHQIDMAVREAIINAIWHGNKNDASKSVSLRFEIYQDRIEIRVRDQGDGFSLAEVPDPCLAENLLKFSGQRDIPDPHFYGRTSGKMPSWLGNRSNHGEATRPGTLT